MNEDDVVTLDDGHRAKLAREGFLEVTEDMPDGAELVDGKIRRISIGTKEWWKAPFDLRYFKRGWGPKAEYKLVVARRGKQS